MPNTITTYAEAAAVYGKAARSSRFSGRVKVGNNTYLHLSRHSMPGDEPTYAITYHATEVVRYFPNGDLVVDTGGYFTSTTMLRLNRFTPAHYGFHRVNFEPKMTDRRCETTTPMTGAAMLVSADVTLAA